MKVEGGAVNGAVTPLTGRMDKLESNLVERLQTLRKEVVRSDLMQLNDTLRKLNSDAVQMTGPDLRTLQATTNQLSTKLNELGEQLRDFLRAVAFFNVTTLAT
jgi:ABC-type transporter Mla subunit MlaD